MAWGSWIALIGGIVAVIGQWTVQWYLPLIGGVIAIIGAIGDMAE